MEARSCRKPGVAISLALALIVTCATAEGVLAVPAPGHSLGGGAAPRLRWLHRVEDRARAAIVGGSAVEITRAPWQVAVAAEYR